MRLAREKKSMERLKGKTAMVVGAGSIGPGWGNGKATAVIFAREGAQVFCVDRNAAAAKETVEIITGEGGKATAFTADVSREREVEAMVSACLKAYGRIDVLDNNVGIAEMGNVVEVNEASWDHVFAVNLKSAYFAMKHVIPIMQKQGGGSIINISSIASIRHLGISYVTYGASKAATRPRSPPTSPVPATSRQWWRLALKPMAASMCSTTMSGSPKWEAWSRYRKRIGTACSRSISRAPISA